MSESPDTVDDVLHKLSDQLTCGICMDIYREPKVLPCLHVFCTACIEKLVSQDGTSIMCPKCKQSKWLPEIGVQNLQSPFCIQHLIEVQDTLEKVRNNVLKCEHCGKHTAMTFCGNCSEFYCKNCSEEHHSWRGFVNHKFDTVDDVEKEAVNLVPFKKVELVCSKHDGKTPEIYCETCEEMICESCLVKDHRKCTSSLVEECYPKHLDAITASLDPVKQQLDTVNQTVEEMEARARKLAEQAKAAKQKIEDQITQLHEVLEARKEELAAQVDRLERQSQETIEAQRADYKLLHTQLSGSMEFVNKSLRTGSKAEVLSIKKKVVEHLQQVSEDYKAHMIQPEPDQTLRFGHQNLTDNIQRFGKVFLISSVSPRHSCEMEHQLEASTATGAQKRPRPPPPKPAHSYSHIPSYMDFQGMFIRSITGFKEPRQLVIRTNGEIIIAEKQADIVSILDSNGRVLRTLGQISTGALSKPRGVALCGPDTILVAADHCIRKFTWYGKRLASVGTEGHGRLQFNSPWALEFNHLNNKVYVCDTGNHRIQILNNDLTFFGEFGSKGNGQGQFKCPTGIAVDSVGDIYVADFFNNRIQVFDKLGNFVREITQRGPGMGRLKAPVCVCIDGNDSMYVFESNEYCISVFNNRSQFVKSVGGRGDKPGEFICPYGMAIDAAGKVYVSDTHHHNIQVFR